MKWRKTHKGEQLVYDNLNRSLVYLSTCQLVNLALYQDVQLISHEKMQISVILFNLDVKEKGATVITARKEEGRVNRRKKRGRERENKRQHKKTVFVIVLLRYSVN